MPHWKTDEKALRDYRLGTLGTTVGSPQWRMVRDIDGVPPVCPNCRGRIVQVRVRTRSDQLRGGEGWSYYFGCPCCPFASPALLVSDHVPRPYEDMAIGPWITP